MVRMMSTRVIDRAARTSRDSDGYRLVDDGGRVVATVCPQNQDV